MFSQFPLRWVASFILVVAAIQLPCAAQPAASPPFRLHVLNAESEFSAAAALDVNEDGKLDIVSGAWWYQNPSWQRHRFREVQQIRGRYDDYSNLTTDVDLDGDQDIVSVNYRSKSIYWCENPGGGKDQLWVSHVLAEPGTSETGRLVDVDGDGRLDVLPNGTTFAAWFEFKPDSDGKMTLERHPLPDELAGHGLGAGDLNGDGRTDIVCPRGWAESPAEPSRGRWIWHPEFQLARDAGIPIVCHDVDRDGDCDLIWGRGHDIGLYWTEQVGASEFSVQFTQAKPADPSVVGQLATGKWITHAIDTSWACGHTLMLADIDGDGHDDLVTAKRFLGHDGRDPGENDPLGVYWYRFDVNQGRWQAHVISSGGRCGIDLDSQCVDIDADGDIDILAPARSGLHWLENLRRSPSDNVAVLGLDEVGAPEYTDHFQFATVQMRDLEGAWSAQPLATPLDHGYRRQHALRQMERVMGSLPTSAARSPLDVQVISIEPQEGYRRIKLSYQAESGDRVPAYLLVPAELKSPRPAILCLRPTHFELGKSQVCGMGGNANRFYGHELAQLGYVCLVPDYPGFGEYAFDFAAASERFASGTMKAIWNNIRGIDLLEALPCVDRDRIGAMGHSLGGHNALFTAAFDQRIRCVMTSCGFNAFHDYYGGDLKGWSSDRYMPRISSLYGRDPDRMPFDFPEVLAAIAPRPILVSAPLHDTNFPVVGVRKCEAAVRPLYDRLAVPGDCQFLYPDCPHDFPEAIRKQAYTWFDEHLKREDSK